LAEQGLRASSKEIARRAGVGIATLFRRFPTRQDLLVATFGPKLAAYTEAICECRTGWSGTGWSGWSWSCRSVRDSRSN
jgi:AcrR family transcriptional regulator